MNKETDIKSQEPTGGTQRPYFQNRELSWLAFNERVLEQGVDKTVPLLERLRFIAIFSSNLREFFMIRVGSLTDLNLIKKPLIDNKTGLTPAQQLDAIYERCHSLYPIQENVFNQVKEKLSHEGIHQLDAKELNEDQLAFLQHYFDKNVMPFLSPQIINLLHPFPHLENGELYVVVRLDKMVPKNGEALKKDHAETKTGKASAIAPAEKDERKKEGKKGKNRGAEGVTLGIIPLPRNYERIIPLPGSGFSFILLEDVLELFAPEVFSMYTVKHANTICVTRNADLDASEGIDENDEDYRAHMKRILKKRARLAPVRLESRKPLSDTMSTFLLRRLDLKKHQAFITSVPLDMSYCFTLDQHLDSDQRESLQHPDFSPQWPAELSHSRTIIDQVTEAEILLSYPYESMDPFIQLLREAALDPQVISIKITLYRLADRSHLAEALIAAAEAGKEVTALFELRARFDESNNIEWSQRFEQAGAKVLYGFHDYKVHSKICCITRQTDAGVQYITQLGTGNYNEKTAKLYTDFAFITTDESFGRDAVKYFRNMSLENVSDDYDILLVAPLQIKSTILKNIDAEIEKARRGQESGLFFKTNAITDKEVVEKLVEASQANVPVVLFVRGICCLVPGIAGYTDNIRVVSVVGRLLEHSRIFGFGSFDSMQLYLSSADLMTRNMDRRVEIAWPVLNEKLRHFIIEYLKTMLIDTAKLRELCPDKTYTPLGHFTKVDDQGKRAPFDAQEFLIKDAYEKRLAAAHQEVTQKANEISSSTGEKRPKKQGLFARLGSLFRRNSR